MASDSVPAPMVQLPVSALSERDVVYPAKLAFGPSANYELGVLDERARLRKLVVDAATPAASVPVTEAAVNAGADAIAEAWSSDEDYPAPSAADLARAALVAAAEQADNGEARTTCTHGNDIRVRCDDCEGWTYMGEAADTPRDECDHTLYTNTHRCTKCGDEVAPAAPPEPDCRCGHGPDLHYKNGTCFGAYARGCTCPKFNPRVPVNDEAEAVLRERLLTVRQDPEWQGIWVQHAIAILGKHIDYLAARREGNSDE